MMLVDSWFVCDNGDRLISGQFGEGGVHLVGKALVSVLVKSQFVCEKVHTREALIHGAGALSQEDGPTNLGDL